MSIHCIPDYWVIFALLLYSEALSAMPKAKHMAPASWALMCMINFNYAGSLGDLIYCTEFGFWGMRALAYVLVLWLSRQWDWLDGVLWYPSSLHTQIVLHSYKAFKEQGHMGMSGSPVSTEAE